jgi:DHA1 family inner membrane transport protein
VLGYAGVFAVFTYIAPLLTEVSGFREAAVSPILLVFGGGLIAGNLAGGKVADRWLVPAVLGSLVMLAVVLATMSFAIHSQVMAVIYVGLLGAAAFGTVAPLQMRVLRHAGTGGQTLASSLNIGAFNLGNAIGAWLGGIIIAHCSGLASIPWIASLVALGSVVTALLSRSQESSADAAALPEGEM